VYTENTSIRYHALRVNAANIKFLMTASPDLRV